MPVILKVSESITSTDVNGLANIVPSVAGFGAPVEVDLAVTAGTSAMLDYPLEVLPVESGVTHDSGNNAPPAGRHPLRSPREVEGFR